MSRQPTNEETKILNAVNKVSFIELYRGILELHRLVDEYGDFTLKIKFANELRRILKMDEWDW